SGIVVTDKLLKDAALNWTITSKDGFDSASLTPEANDVLLTASKATLPGGGTLTIVVSAPIDQSIFGPPPGNPQNPPDPVPLDLFELDGNAKTGDLTSGGGGPSTTVSTDWDNVWKDAGSPLPTSSNPLPSKNFEFGTLSGARAG